MKPNVLSPKPDFLSNPKQADAFMEIVCSPSFRHAAQVALAEYAMRLPGSDPRSTYRLAGAREMLDLLLTLGTPGNINMAYIPEDLSPV